MQRHESFNDIARQGGVDLVLLGDSITHGWEEQDDIWAQYYAPRNAANFGISGDRTEHVLWRIDHGNFDGIYPRLVVIMIGTNNCEDNTPQEIADGVTAIVQKLRVKLPDTKILLLAIFPRGARADNELRAVNTAANDIFQNIAYNKTIYYLDIGDVFLDEQGTLSREVMPDRLHPEAHGYQLWADAMEPKVAELIGE